MRGTPGCAAPWVSIALLLVSTVLVFHQTRWVGAPCVLLCWGSVLLKVVFLTPKSKERSQEGP